MTTAIQTREQQKSLRFNSVRRLLESEGVRLQVARALPKHMTPERILRIGVTALQNNPRLLECTEGSLVKAITEAAELGLEVNTPLGYAYLVPYKDQVTLQVGYRGFINLAHRSGKISSMAAEIVYEHDQFAIQLGTNRNLMHVPMMSGDRGKKIGAYATVLFRDGTTDFEYMTADDIAMIRGRSAGAKQSNGPWTTDENEMWRKTPIRRLAKRLPMTADDQGLLRAAIIDEYNDAGVSPYGTPPAALPKPEVISEDQRMALAAAAKKSGCDLAQIVNDAGFEVMANITLDAYDDILAAVSQKPEPPKEPEQNDSRAIVGQAVFSEDEAIRIDLMEAVNGLITERVGGLPGDRKRYLKGRDLNQLTAEELEDMLAELQSM